MSDARRMPFGLILIIGLVALATVGVAALLMNILERKTEAKSRHLRLVGWWLLVVLLIQQR